MDVLNRFYSSMTSKVTQFSGALLGNPVTREFEATQFIATAGPGLLWKVYKGFKKSTKQEVAIFIFEKKQLDHIPKPEVILETLKRGITQLTKLRHPNILTVQYSLEESRDCLAFASEPVIGSLANILGDCGNVGTLAGDAFPSYNLLEPEIKYGLLNIIEGLAFLHNDVKLLHKNICPQSILINQKGAWKIFGFDMYIANTSPVGHPETWPFVGYSPNQHHLAQPMLDYMAPEHFHAKRHSRASDIYSFGMLIYVIFSPEHQPLGKIGNNFNKYEMFAREIRNMPPPGLNCVPSGLQDFVKLMLNPIPELRPDLHQLSQAPYFDDVAIRTLKYIDSLVQRDNKHRSKFFKNLIQIIPTLPQRINMERVLPCLLNEFSNTQMLPFVLPNVFLIAESCETSDYEKSILPALKQAMRVQNPIQVQVIFMNKLDFLMKLTPSKDIQSDLLPMVYQALDTDVQQMQEMSMNALPSLIHLIDYTTMKNAVIPRIRKLITSTTDVSMKVKGLLFLSKLVESMEKWLITEEVVPFLLHLPVKEPAVLMAVLGIFTMIMNNSKQGISKEDLVQDVLPFLLPLTLENTLTVKQFQTLMNLIKLMLQKLESEQKATLSQVNSMNNVESYKTVEKAVMQETEKPVMQNVMDFFPQPRSPSPKTNCIPPPAPVVQMGTPASTGNYDSLSFEDKQRLAKQQEQVRAMCLQRCMSTAKSMKTATTSPSFYESIPQSITSSFYDALSNGLSPKSSNTTLEKSEKTSPILEMTESKTSILLPSTAVPNPSLTAINNNIDTKRGLPKFNQDWSDFDNLLPKNTKNNNTTKKPAANSEMIDLLS